jgi:hypothetical protein
LDPLLNVAWIGRCIHCVKLRIAIRIAGAICSGSAAVTAAPCRYGRCAARVRLADPAGTSAGFTVIGLGCGAHGFAAFVDPLHSMFPASASDRRRSPPSVSVTPVHG